MNENPKHLYVNENLEFLSVRVGAVIAQQFATDVLVFICCKVIDVIPISRQDIIYYCISLYRE